MIGRFEGVSRQADAGLGLSRQERSDLSSPSMDVLKDKMKEFMSGAREQKVQSGGEGLDGGQKSPNELFAAFGYDENAFRKSLIESMGISKDGPRLKNSRELDFWEAFDEYSDESLYSHNTFGNQEEQSRQKGPNCMAYAYGCSKEVNGSTFSEKPAPGHFAGIDTSGELDSVMRHGSPQAIKETFEKYMKMDFDAMGKQLVEVESNDYQPGSGERMIALVTSPEIPFVGADFHFYVKGNNGFWSHKPGVTNPTIFDDSGRTIRDPKDCDRGCYTNFVGFYVIKDK